VFVVDTNILVYAANIDCVEHDRCSQLVGGWRSSPAPWCVTHGILYEFLSVITHRGELASPWSVAKAWGFVESLLDSPGLQVLTETPRHVEIARMTFEEVSGPSGRHLHDAHVAILMREHGISRIVTRDTGFHRFPFIEVVDPLTGSWELHESRPGGPHHSSRSRHGEPAVRRKRAAARVPAPRPRHR